MAPGANPGDGGQLPNEVTLGSYIVGASWQAPLASQPNGGAPWGTIAGVGDADWIWHDTFANHSSSDTRFAMFRSANPLVTAVPEAQTWALLLAGLGLIALRTSRQRS